jgi:hypothetical protein
MGIASMDDCTRPSFISRRVPAFLPVMMLLNLAVFPLAQAALASQSDHENPVILATARSQTHEIMASEVVTGDESLHLSARLTETAFETLPDISWQIKNAAGEQKLVSTRGEASAKLPPGSYVILAHYGASRIMQEITLPAGKSLALSFILNAGALRILPRLENLPVLLQANARVFALDGHDRGRLVAISKTAGELLNLPEGNYRVESSFANGNAKAVADVRVKRGIISALELSHKAGLARLNYVGANQAKVEWQLNSADGENLARDSGFHIDAALQPGSYNAYAKIGDETLSATFEIKSGEAREITLGN